jgi:hypothetical protein
MFLIGIFFIFIGIIALIYSNYKIKNVHIYNEEIDKQNARLKEQETELLAKVSKLQLESKQLEFNNNLLSKEEDKIKVKVQKEIDNLSTIQNKIQITLENQKEISQNAFENYCDILSQLYKDKDEERSNHLFRLRYYPPHILQVHIRQGLLPQARKKVLQDVQAFFRRNRKQ